MFEDIAKKESSIALKICSLKNTLDKKSLFDEIDDEIVKIKKAIASHYENIGIFLDIININAGVISNYNECSILSAVNIQKDDLKSKTNKLEATFCPHYTDKGDFLITHGKFNEALDAWESVLRTDPGNEYVHLKLTKSIIDQNNDIKHRVAGLKNKYRFKYLRSFGRDKIQKPVYLCGSEINNMMFVSDYGSHKIHRFTFDGESLGAMPLEVKKPIGLFIENENCLWICDSGNNRLLCADFNGTLLEEINIKKMFNRHFNDDNDTIILAHICIRRDQIYLAVHSETRRKSWLVSFDRNNQTTSLETISIDNLSLIMEIKFINNVLFAAKYEPGRLFSFKPEKKRFVQFSDVQSIDRVRRLVGIDDHLLIATNKHVLKMDLTGKLVWSVALEKIIQSSCVLTGLTVSKKKKILFVADHSQRSIHMFSI